ncbi:MAG: DNA methyltransferase [Planctomycetales bacterium]
MPHELDYGQRERDLFGVDPHQFLGIEVNPRAAAIADLVLWIGYLQWHTRTRNLNDISEPIIQKYHNIECRDAVLAWDRVEEVKDEHGQPVTRWDGHTTKKHPVTGEDVPDETAQVPVLRYINPRKAEWPQAEFIVGNPPFLGSKRMRECMGDAYTDAVQSAWPMIPQASDFVLRWWHIAAELLSNETLRQFGFITTNSMSQVYNRRVVEPFFSPEQRVHFVFAVPDHPWVDSSDGAAVRISMTAAGRGSGTGKVVKVIKESESSDDDGDLVVQSLEENGDINVDLTIGAPVVDAVSLQSNKDLCAVGMKTIGAAFQVHADEAHELGLGKSTGIEKHIRPYINGRDFAGERRGIYVIDFFGLSETDVRDRFPVAYQHLLTHVKPERDHNRNSIFRDYWWIIGHPRPVFRKFTHNLSRFIATIETSKHRFFGFLPSSITPDSTLVTFGFSDAFYIGILSSRIHVIWAFAAGGRLGVGNDPRYNKTRCFEPFPFPVANSKQQDCIRELGEQLDAHRKKQQALHPDLTLTGMYNVLEKLRSGEPLTAKEKVIHEQGLVSVLKQIHDDLDAAVFEAYGWPSTLTDEEILERLVALNAERAAEEKQGLIRWLRPEFQNPPTDTKTQKTITVEEDEEETPQPKTKKPKAEKPAKKLPWPKKLSDQAQAIVQQLQAAPNPSRSPNSPNPSRANVDQLSKCSPRWSLSARPANSSPKIHRRLTA